MWFIINIIIWILYAKDDGNGDVSNIRKKKRTLYSNAEGMGERMQQKIKEMLIKMKFLIQQEN